MTIAGMWAQCGDELEIEGEPESAIEEVVIVRRTQYILDKRNSKGACENIVYMWLLLKTDINQLHLVGP